jgi:hypothetical protein
LLIGLDIALVPSAEPLHKVRGRLTRLVVPGGFCGVMPPGDLDGSGNGRRVRTPPTVGRWTFKLGS